jgi:hypothetical protein
MAATRQRVLAYFELLDADMGKARRKGAIPTPPSLPSHVCKITTTGAAPDLTKPVLRSKAFDLNELINADLEEKEGANREQVVNTRVGQGLYRQRLEKIEPKCRVTDVTDKRHLVASHIKPWRACDDIEKVDGNNGLLLSPHIDHLFDQGYISFSASGDMLFSSHLDQEVIKRWSLEVKNVGEFNVRQSQYLKYHREHIFKK